MPKSLATRSRQPVSVEQYISSHPPGHRPVMRQLRALIHDAVPDLIERYYPGWKLIGYRALKDGKSHYFCYLSSDSRRVEIGFEYGKLLSDPDGMLEGSRSQVRKVVIRRKSDLRRSAIARLIIEAASIAIDKKCL